MKTTNPQYSSSAYPNNIAHYTQGGNLPNANGISQNQQPLYQHSHSQQVPLQQQNQNVSYSRSHSRNSHHQASENNSSNPQVAQKYVKPSAGSSLTSSQQGTLYNNSQVWENHNNLNGNKLAPSQTGGARPTQTSNILNNSQLNNHVSSSGNSFKPTQQQQLPQQQQQSQQQKEQQMQQASQKLQQLQGSGNKPTNESKSNNIQPSSNNTQNLQQQSNGSIQQQGVNSSLKAPVNLSKTVVANRQLQPAKKRKPFECGGTTFAVDDNYEFCKQIGHGAYGVVCSGVDTKINKKIAIKKITNAFEDLVDAKRILREIKILKFIDHENIIALHDIVVPEQRTGYEDIYIVTELMETDLHRVIYSRQDLTDDHIQYFLYQTLRAMLYIHSANVMHRDLKPSNILVNKNCDLKVCDLGLARGFENDEEDGKTEYVVTRWYRAPEVILKASKYTKSIDVWSIGCIFAELLGRTPLFPGKDYLEQIQRIIAILGTPSSEELSYISNESALKYVKGLPKRTKQSWESLYPSSNPIGLDLLSKMLTFNPDDRYTVEESLQHPYFEGLHNPEEEPVAPQHFDWSWDDFHLTKEKLQSMVYDEAVTYQKIKAENDLLQQQGSSQ